MVGDSASQKRGFTLIELLAVMAIMVILTGVLLAKNSSFGGTIILRSLAYDVALSVREAQTYGIAVRRTASGTFGSGYGIEVRSASPSSYLLFSDDNGNGYYDGESELVTRYELKQGYIISNLCYTSAIEAEVCGAQKVDVTFVRPEPDAYIRVNDSASLNQQARIIISSPNGSAASVLMEITGQISVQ